MNFGKTNYCSIKRSLFHVNNWPQTSFFVVGVFVIALAHFISYAPLKDDIENGAFQAAVALIVYLTVYAVYLLYIENKTDFIWKFLKYIFLFKVALAILNYSIPLFPPKQDAMQNIEMAKEIALAWNEGRLLFYFSKPVEPGYVIPLAVLYFIFGNNIYLACFYNILALTAATYFLYRVTIIIFGKEEAIIACIFFSFMPYLNFMSFSINREAIVISFMMFVGYITVVWLKEKKFRHKLILLIFVCYLAVLRQELFIILVCYLSIICFINSYRFLKKYVFSIKIISISILITVAFGISIYLICNNSLILQQFHVGNISPEALYNRAYRHVHFGFAYLPASAPDSWFELFFFYGPLQSINFLLRPFPWEIFRPNQLFLVVNNLLLYLLYLMSLFGVLRLLLCRNLPFFIAIIAFLFISIFPSSLVQGNGFAAARHREQFIFFIYILGAGGFTLFLRFIKDAVKANRNEHRFKIFNNVKNETVLF